MSTRERKTPYIEAIIINEIIIIILIYLSHCYECTVIVVDRMDVLWGNGTPASKTNALGRWSDIFGLRKFSSHSRCELRWSFQNLQLLTIQVQIFSRIMSSRFFLFIILIYMSTFSRQTMLIFQGIKINIYDHGESAHNVSHPCIGSAW